MISPCTLSRLPDGRWRVRHSSSELGQVDISDSSREAALNRMSRELQYRMELCPCSGVSLGSVELLVSEAASGAADR